MESARPNPGPENLQVNKVNVGKQLETEAQLHSVIHIFVGSHFTLP